MRIEKLVIVSKTKMKNNLVCIGGITEEGRSIRLMVVGARNHPRDTEFNVRQVWDIEGSNRTDITQPHVEDFIVTGKNKLGSLKGTVQMIHILEKRDVPIWRGGPEELFDGVLQWSDFGSGCITEVGGVPDCSVGFWIPDRPLFHTILYDKVKYRYETFDGRRIIPFVGFEDPIEVIPAGSLVRVSLARWWRRDSFSDRQCSLQLSGWYDL